MNMKKKSKKPAKPATVEVSMQFALPHATEVFVTGTFDNWSRTTMPLRRNGDGIWGAALWLAPGQYEYRLVIDGEWADVPGARETVENAFGSRNAILKVEAGA